MHNRNEVLDILRQNLPVLQTEYGLRSLQLFGSAARDEITPQSDIDLIADFERPIGLRFVEFVEYLERLLGTKADVLTPTGVKSIRNSRVVKAITESAIRV